MARDRSVDEMIGLGAAGGLAFHPDGKTLAVSDSANRRDKNGSGGVLLVAVRPVRAKGNNG